MKIIQINIIEDTKAKSSSFIIFGLSDTGVLHVNENGKWRSWNSYLKTPNKESNVYKGKYKKSV